MLPSKQKQALLLLLGVLLGIAIAIVVLLFANKKEKTLSFKSQDIAQSLKGTKAYNQYTNPANTYSKTSAKHFYPFNPNTDSKEQLVQAGFSPGQAKNIVNYVRSGGSFRKKEDLRKLYCMSSWLYEHCSAYATFSQQEKAQAQKQEQKQQKPLPSFKNEEKKTIIIDLNTCDSLDLQLLPGIGVVFSHRIIMYRQKLGGYVSKGQLMEVYGMTNELYNSIAPNLTISKTHIRKIKINSATIKELVHHPYIDFYLAKAIIKYRTEHGVISSIDELRVIHLMDQSTYEKLLPYLEL